MIKVIESREQFTDEALRLGIFPTKVIQQKVVRELMDKAREHIVFSQEEDPYSLMTTISAKLYVIPDIKALVEGISRFIDEAYQNGFIDGSKQTTNAVSRQESHDVDESRTDQ